MWINRLPSAKLTEVSEVARKKAPSPIEVTFFGMIIEDKEDAPSKAQMPMLDSLLPSAKLTEVNPSASSNASSPIAVTSAGISASPVQDEPFLTTLFEIVKLPEMEQVTVCAAFAGVGTKINNKVVAIAMPNILFCN